MRNFWMLVGFEYKKLLKKKITWITVILLVLLMAFSASTLIIGNYYVNGKLVGSNLSAVKMDIAYAKELSGRKLDQTLLDEAGAAYDKVPADAEVYIATEEYQTYARPYSTVFNWARQAARLEESGPHILNGLTEELLYEKREAAQLDVWNTMSLTEGEISYLQEEDAAVDKPFTFRYAEAYSIITDVAYTLGTMQILLIAICIPGIFSEEYAKKTHPLLTSSRLGKKELYGAKLFTAVSFSLVTALLMWLSLIGTCLMIYGTDGFTAQIQNLSPLLPWNLTAGEAVLIEIMLSLASAVLFSGVAVFLGEKLKNGVAAMSILTAAMIAIMVFNIPEQYRVLGQIWDWLPGSISAVWNAFDTRLVKIFGTYFTAWETTPVIYLLLFLLFAALGVRSFCKADKA